MIHECYIDAVTRDMGGIEDVLLYMPRINLESNLDCKLTKKKVEEIWCRTRNEFNGSPSSAMLVVRSVHRFEELRMRKIRI